MRRTNASGFFDGSVDSTEEDPFFNPEEIAFKVRLQSHKDRKSLVKRLVNSN